METELLNVMNNCMRTPLTVGVIVINDMGLCICCRGELHESDAGPIAALIAQATKDEPVEMGELPYQSKRLQFYHTDDFTLVLLRLPVPSPASSLSHSESTISKSVDSATSRATAGTIRAPQNNHPSGDAV
ncbi:hypothetical protein FRC02_001502 [Tulasnella sp. 418]|nr:hypothetical protein FRC02_001502 [Tulasnella sp. 418]